MATSSLGEVRTIVLIALVALVSPGVARAAPPPLLSRVASSFVGHAVTVQCAGDAEFQAGAHTREAEGYAEPEHSRATLRAWGCAQLARFAQGRGDAEMAGQVALVLTHETTHLTGVLDEGQTECLAVRNVWRMLRLFHQSARRTRIAYRAAVELHAQAPRDYRTIC